MQNAELILYCSKFRIKAPIFSISLFLGGLTDRRVLDHSLLIKIQFLYDLRCC